MKARNAQIDLLRLVAMLMIICGHLIYHGIQHVAGPPTTPVPFADSTAGQFNFVWLHDSFVMYKGTTILNFGS